MTSWSRVIPGVGAAVLVGMLGACNHGSSGPAGVLRASGDVQVAGVEVGSAAIGSSAAATESTNATAARTARVTNGQLVAVGNGEARITLPDGGQMDVGSGSIVRYGATPQLINGEAVVSSPSTTTHVSTTVADVAVHGIARFQRDLALTVGTYQGTATISGDHSVVVPALTQDTVASISVIPSPGPLHLDPTDVWDQKYMGAALDVTDQLDSEMTYLDANVPKDASTSATFLTRALHTNAVTQSLLDSAVVNSVVPPAGEQLAAAAVAMSGRGDFASRWQQIFELRDAGAQWGIVVMYEQADPKMVTTLIEQAVANGAFVDSPPPPPPAVALEAVPTPTPPPAATPPTTAHSVAPTKAKSPTFHQTPPTIGAPTPPTTQPTTGLLAPVVNPLLQLVQNLLRPTPKP